MNEYLEKFKKICELSDRLDPDNELDWYSLSIGFFIAHRLSMKYAHELAIEAKYKHQYWNDDEGSKSKNKKV